MASAIRLCGTLNHLLKYDLNLFPFFLSEFVIGNTAHCLLVLSFVCLNRICKESQVANWPLP